MIDISKLTLEDLLQLQEDVAKAIREQVKVLSDIKIKLKIPEKEVEKKNLALKKEAIRDLTYFLNENYKSSFTTESLLPEFSEMLKNYDQEELIDDYIKYFLENGMLSIDEGSNVYQIKKTNLIPKRRKKEDEGGLGIFEQLGM